MMRASSWAAEPGSVGGLREVTILNIVGDLTKRFPNSAPSHVQALVGQEYDALAANPIQMFISNLIEHDARRRLRSEVQDGRLKATETRESTGTGYEGR